MSDSHEQTCGMRISAYRARLDEPASITLTILGGNNLAFLTPDEADRLAEALHNAATAARTKP